MISTWLHSFSFYHLTSVVVLCIIYSIFINVFVWQQNNLVVWCMLILLWWFDMCWLSYDCLLTFLLSLDVSTFWFSGVTWTDFPVVVCCLLTFLWCGKVWWLSFSGEMCADFQLRVLHLWSNNYSVLVLHVATLLWWYYVWLA